MKKLVTLVLVFCTLVTEATHLKAGYITVERTSATARTCKITITVYTDTRSPVLFGGEQDVLDFGDGTTMLIPETPSIPLTGSANVGVASYTVTHTFPAGGSFLISYIEPNRNEGVMNMENSVLTTFYIETNINLDSHDWFSSTPEFLTPPIFHVVTQSDVSLSLGAVSKDDYIVSYELGTPYRDRGTPVSGYQLPENFQINPHNGLVTWDTKFNGMFCLGEFIYTVKVHLYKKEGDITYRVCTVSADFQIIVEDFPFMGIVYDTTDTDENGRLFIPNNNSRTVKIFFEVPTAAPDPEVIAYSEISDNGDAFSFTTYDSSTAPHIHVGVLTLHSIHSINRVNPYLITVRGKHSGQYSSDLLYLFYTQDLHPEEIVLAVYKEEALIQLFPNPSKDFVKILVPGNQVGTVMVYDATGNLIHSQTGNVIDIHHLKRGLYFCTVRYGSKIKRAKFIKD
ncbi:MAG: T9SS type A sorting domain-containing protein [Cyclobacteriaceae bacterium]